MARLQNYIDEAYVPTQQEDIPDDCRDAEGQRRRHPGADRSVRGRRRDAAATGRRLGITPEKTYGIEVNYRRHAALAQRLPAGNSLLADITMAKCSTWAFDIAYVNPPYGDFSTFERWESTFLNWITTGCAAAGAVLVVPYSQVVTDGT
jgi:hypothetical protein